MPKRIFLIMNETDGLPPPPKMPRQSSSCKKARYKDPKESTTFLWIIKDFRNWPANDRSVLKTVAIQVNELTSTKCHISIYPRPEEPQQLDVELKWHYPCTNLVTYLIKASILDVKFCEVNRVHQFHVFSIRKHVIKFEHFIDRNCLLKNSEKFLFNDDLVLYFEITVFEKPLSEEEVNSNSLMRSNLAETTRLLFQSKSFSDFVFNVKDKQFFCHKALLACRSEFFSNMFKHNMKETRENQLVLTDIEPDVFEKFLFYIYTGRVDVTAKEAVQLWVAADKYGLDRLKTVCEAELNSSLSFENSVEIFRFACFYNLHRLKYKSLLILKFRKHWVGFDSERSPQLLLLSPVKNIGPGFPVGIEMSFSGPPALTCGKGDKKTIPPHADILLLTENQISLKTVWTVKIDETAFESYETMFSRTVISSHIATSRNNDVWQICVCTNLEHGKKSSEPPEYLSLYLSLISSDKEWVFTEYRFSIINENQQECNFLTGTDKFFCNDCFWNISSRYVKIDDILSRDELLKDCINIQMCFSLITRNCSDYDCSPPRISKCDLVSNISTLLNDKNFTDVAVKIGKKLFHCHKALLAAHSPYFASKFQGNPLTEVLEIKGISASDFRELLSVIYTGRCELEPLELLPLANNYGLHCVKTACEDALIKALSVENSVKTLIFADSQKAGKLKKYTLDFIGQNLEKIVDTPDWLEIAKHARLQVECLNAYIG